MGSIPIVKLDTFRGEIRVEPSESGRVELVLAASTPGIEPDAWLRNIEVKSTPFGAGLVISVANTGGEVEFGLSEKSDRSLALTLRVPQVSNLDIRARQGSIEIGNDFEGRTRARLERGSVFVGRTKGSVVAQTEMGTISVARVSGDLTATTRSGNIFVGSVFGWAELHTESGDIEISNTLGGIDAVANAGSVQVGVEQSLAKNSRIEANVGDITLSLNPRSQMALDARARWGSVQTGIPFEVDEGLQNEARIQGSLNGGGPLLALSSHGGNVKIKPAHRFEF